MQVRARTPGGGRTSAARGRGRARGGAPDEAYAEFRALRAARLAHAIARGGQELFEREHDRIGEVVLARIGEAARSALHAQLARAIECERLDQPELLIEQYVGARMPLEAARCARGAADRALASLAFARAAQLYERALELAPWSPDDLAVLHGNHAAALEHAGRTLAAAAAYAVAAARAPEPLAAARFEQRAAELWMHNGEYVAGERMLRRGYARLGLRWPEGRMALVVAIASLLLPQRVRQLFGRGASDALRRARAEFLSGAGRGIQNYDLLRAAYNALRCFDESERLPDPVWHARAGGARGLMWSLMLGPFGIARGLRQSSGRAPSQSSSAMSRPKPTCSASSPARTLHRPCCVRRSRPRTAARRASDAARMGQLNLHPVMGLIGCVPCSTSAGCARRVSAGARSSTRRGCTAT